jgi:TolB-like protein/Tfp pilus assembly protein PilF
VAVLPFANLGGDPEDDYFSDGLSEELLNALAQVEGLQVAARTSAFAFRGRNEDVREIARQLGVATVVEGSVRRQNERVRITAQLIQASDGFHLWSGTYDGGIADVFALQDSVSQAIATALQVTLGLEGRSRRERGLTEDLAAFDLYLLGRHHWAQRNIPEVIRYYGQAIAQDSTFALAYAGLADVHLIRPFYDYGFSFADGARAARPLAERALALSPERGEVQATAGLLALYGDWDFERARRHLDRAVELAPSYTWAFHFRRQVAMVQGRYFDALADSRTALTLDPLSPIVVANHGNVLMTVDSLDAALEYFRRGIAAPGIAPFVFREYAVTLRDLGRHEESAEIFRKWAAAVGYAHPERAAIMATPATTPAEQAAVRALLDDIVAKTGARRADLMWEYFLAGPDAFFDAADDAVAERHVWVIFLTHPLVKEPFLSDPRYGELLERVGLQPGRTP